MNPQNNNQPQNTTQPTQPQNPQPLTPQTQPAPQQPQTQFNPQNHTTEPTAHPQAQGHMTHLDQTQSQHAGKKSSKIVFIVIGAALAVLTIIGLAYFFLFSSASSSLNTSSNDITRKLDATSLLASAENFYGNSNGVYPTFSQMSSVIIPQYVLGDSGSRARVGKADFNDPATDEPYIIVKTSPGLGEIQYSEYSTCSGKDAVRADSPRRIAVRIFLEAEQDFYCADNS